MTTEHISAGANDRSSDILTPDAIAFVAQLARTFAPRLDALLLARAARRQALAAGATLDFAPATKAIRDGDWRVAEIPPDLRRRVVEITGPVDRKMIINALNSGADAFMADFEDATAPSWSNLIDGQVNLRDAVRRTIQYTDPSTNKSYRLAERIATLIMRPRGLHLPESHMTVDGEPVPGPLFDAGLFLFHNARELIERGSGPYFYLPKLEHADEASWWNDVFVAAEKELGLTRGVIKATVLIETLPAAFRDG